jgi:FkbM family methyltransferase
MKLIAKFSKAIKYLNYFLKDNGFLLLFLYFLFRVLKKKKLIKIKVNGSHTLIRANSHDLSVALHTLYDEYDSLKFLTIPESGSLIIDAGGYIGTASIALTKIFPQSTILSIEPSPQNFEILKKNILPYRNIIPINAALVKNMDVHRVPLKDRGTGQWGFSISKEVSNLKSMQLVDCCTIDSLLARFGFEKIFILKLDIEGYEAELFENCYDWIQKTNVIFIELHDRINDRCSINFFNATSDRLNIKAEGEKYLSFGRSSFSD